MSAGTTLRLWLRLGGPTGAVLAGAGAVAASVHLTAVAAVLAGLAAVAVAVTVAGLLRSRS